MVYDIELKAVVHSATVAIDAGNLTVASGIVKRLQTWVEMNGSGHLEFESPTKLFHFTRELVKALDEAICNE